MPYIQKILARQILDSRGFPTLEVDVETSGGSIGRASVPSGSSTGEHEAFELRDGNPDLYHGKSIHRVLEHIRTHIAPVLQERNVLDQEDIDSTLIALDGTDNKSNLGANTLLGVSLACCRAGAVHSRLPLYKYMGGEEARVLPVPLANIINGGLHANNNLDCQEFMILPVGADTCSEGIRWISETFHTLKHILHERSYSVAVGDEGGFAPTLESNEHAIELILTAIERSGRRPGEDIALALDVASSRLYDPITSRYTLHSLNKTLTPEELVEWYALLQKTYPIISIEDAMAEDDWSGWKTLSDRLGAKIQLVGDDLFTTNISRLQNGIRQKICNSILIKPNQIGTLSEATQTIQIARASGYTNIISHRSGETEDTFISDIAVAYNTGQIKIGSSCRTDRTAKYNQLLRIEEQLNTRALYGGKQSFPSIYKPTVSSEITKGLTLHE